jgi:hypothetical protein
VSQTRTLGGESQDNLARYQIERLAAGRFEPGQDTAIFPLAKATTLEEFAFDDTDAASQIKMFTVEVYWGGR